MPFLVGLNYCGSYVGPGLYGCTHCGPVDFMVVLASGLQHAALRDQLCQGHTVHSCANIVRKLTC